jgi:TonB family protein
MKEKRNSWAFLLSILLHIMLLLFLMFQEKRDEMLAEKSVEIEWVDLESLPDPIDEQIQIVQQDEIPLNDRVPEKDYKLSRNNQDVLEETKAEKNGAFQNRKNTAQATASQETPRPSQNTEAPKQKLLNALKPSLFESQYAAAPIEPAPEAALSGVEVSQNDDYLKDVVAGAETHLKTREFVYYSYYNRIKQKLRQHWEPRIKEKIVKILRKGRRIASTNDKITRLVITLDKAGELKRIQVKNASGYNDLDDAAIEAFRAAAPFPNPPNGIVNGEEEVEIPWDFVLET